MNHQIIKKIFLLLVMFTCNAHAANAAYHFKIRCSSTKPFSGIDQCPGDKGYLVSFLQRTVETSLDQLKVINPSVHERLKDWLDSRSEVMLVISSKSIWGVGKRNRFMLSAHG